MTAQIRTASPALVTARSTASSKLYEEGIVAGLLGAATVALWFLIVDTIQGRPLYTPSVLGTAVFRPAALANVEHAPVSFEAALMFTWVHALVFAALGGAVAHFVGLAEKNPNYGFGIVLMFVILMFGLLVAAMLFAEGVLQALTWPAILVGNLLAAAAMAVYFRRRHPDLTILP
jgi:hypothetical protein